MLTSEKAIVRQIWCTYICQLIIDYIEEKGVEIVWEEGPGSSDTRRQHVYARVLCTPKMYKEVVFPGVKELCNRRRVIVKETIRGATSWGWEIIISFSHLTPEEWVEANKHMQVDPAYHKYTKDFIDLMNKHVHPVPLPEES